MRSIKYIIPAILLTILTGCTKTGPDNPVRDDVTVHWAISPGGLGDMGYNDIIFGGISAAANRYDFGLYYYRPESAEEMVPVVEQWASEPQADGTRSLFVLGASDYEVTVRDLMDKGVFPLPEGKDIMMLEYFADDLPVHTIGIVAMSAAYLAGCVADSLDRMCPDLTARYDFFFPYAGGTALGMYRYMRDYSGPWMVVGMDMDQSDLAPDNMCCSMIKRIDRAVVLWMDSRNGPVPHTPRHGLHGQGHHPRPREQPGISQREPLSRQRPHLCRRA